MLTAPREFDRIPRNYTKFYDVLEENSVDYVVSDDGFAWSAFIGGAVAGIVVLVLPVGFIRR